MNSFGLWCRWKKDLLIVGVVLGVFRLLPKWLLNERSRVRVAKWLHALSLQYVDKTRTLGVLDEVTEEELRKVERRGQILETRIRFREKGGW
jgi:hypothetical protein